MRLGPICISASTRDVFTGVNCSQQRCAPSRMPLGQGPSASLCLHSFWQHPVEVQPAALLMLTVSRSLHLSWEMKSSRFTSPHASGQCFTH